MVQEPPKVFSDTQLTSVINGASPMIKSRREGGITAKQVQPSSLDLTLGNKVYGMGVARLPGPGVEVCDLLKRNQYPFTLDEGQPGFLHSGYTYIIPLNEEIALPQMLSAKFSPKSSTGRTDVFVRILADGVSRFDCLPAGYQGKLYLEVTPLSFPVLVTPGLALVQMRIKNGDARLSAKEISVLQSEKGIFLSKDGSIIASHDLQMGEHGVYMHIDLDRDIVGFVARKNGTKVLSLFEEGKHDPEEFWEPIPRSRDGRLVIDPERFYLLATKERVTIPDGVCGDIAPYDTSAGEFRTHYAGFFDPGFGAGVGITGVLEVRGRELRHELSDGDPICLMNFESVGNVGKLYNGNYQNPGPSLSKHFNRRYEVWGK